MTTATPVEVQLEQYRSELTGYCYRMLGSSFEAEDAVQDTFVAIRYSQERSAARGRWTWGRHASRSSRTSTRCPR